MIAQTDPVISKAAAKVRLLSAYERIRDLHERHELAKMDQRNREKWARKEGQEQGQKQERKKWTHIVAAKDTTIAEQQAQIARLQAQLKNQS